MCRFGGGGPALKTGGSLTVFKQEKAAASRAKAGERKGHREWDHGPGNKVRPY